MANWKPPPRLPAQSVRPKGVLLTTKDKIDHAVALAHARSHASSSSSHSPLPTSRKPHSKPSKTTLPPPDEMLAEIERKKTSASTPRKTRTASQPLSTKEKTAAAAANAKKLVRRAAAQEKKAVMAKQKERKKAHDKVNLMDFFRKIGTGAHDQDREEHAKDASGAMKESLKVRDEKTVSRESVLVRLTERSKKWKVEAEKAAALAAKMAAIDGEGLAVQDAEADAKPVIDLISKVFRGEEQSPSKKHLMDLPIALRKRIFRYAVVETSHFLWPDSPTGREQPDLAMADRQIRAEVLPIFYAETVFGVDVCSGSATRLFIGGTITSANIAPLEKWCRVLSEKGHVQGVRNWAFSYFPLDNNTHKTGLLKPEMEDKDVVVSLVYPPPDPDATINTLPLITVHRSAFCLATGHKRYADCRPSPRVAWLEDLVEKTRVPMARRHEQVLAIAKVLEKRAPELVGERCCELQ